MKNVLFILICAIAAFCFVSCEKETTPSPSFIMEYPESMVMAAEGDTIRINVLFNENEVSPTCISSQGFCHSHISAVSKFPDDDLSSMKFIVMAYPNKTGKPRSCEVTYKNKKYDNTLVTFSVYQLAE